MQPDAGGKGAGSPAAVDRGVPPQPRRGPDGFGPPTTNLETWTRLHQGAPAGAFWGWKNVIDEDSPTLTPAETMATGPTSPVVVSYQ